MAFFPCIYFETMSMMYFDCSSQNVKKKPMCGKIDDALERLRYRTMYHSLLYKMFWMAYKKGIRLILENPSTTPNYIVGQQNFFPPTFIDKNRMMRGDYYSKPTAYWFVNCEPTEGCTIQKDKERKVITKSKSAPQAGICSEERSMISPDYARNFICDFILGKSQPEIDPQLF